MVPPPRRGGCQVPGWRRPRDSSGTSMLSPHNHLSVCSSEPVPDCRPPRVIAQGVAGVCFVPHKHLAACRQGLYFTHSVPLQGACCSQDIMLTVHLQCRQGLLKRPMAPAMRAGSWLLRAHFHLHCLSLPSSIHQSPPEETEAGAFTVSILKTENRHRRGLASREA